MREYEIWGFKFPNFNFKQISAFCYTNFKVFNFLLVLHEVKFKIQKKIKRKQVIMMWWKHSHRFLNALIYNAKIMSEKALDATLGKPKRSFVAYLEIILTLLIKTIDTPNEWFRQTIKTYYLMYIFCKSNYIQNYNSSRIEISE